MSPNVATLSVPTRGLMALYDYQQGAVATTLYDKSRNGHNGTFGAGAAAPTWSAAGLVFAGAQGVSVSFATQAPMTIITALAPSSFAGSQIFIASTANNNQDGIAGGKYQSYVGYGAVHAQILTDTTSPVIFESDRGVEGLEVWENGIPIAFSPQSSFPLTEAIKMIGESAYSSFCFLGTIYYQAIYSVILTNSERLQAYQAIQQILAVRGVTVTIPKILRNSIYTAFGDSITVGSGATVGANAYVSLVAAGRDSIITNEGQGGTQITTQIDNILATTIGPYSASTILTGYNDMRCYGTDATKQATYSATLASALAWLALPESHKVRGTSAAVTYTGAWTAIAQGRVGKYSATAGATASFSLTGTTIYVSYLRYTGTAGNFTVTIDGGAPVTVSANVGVTDCVSRAFSEGLYRVTGLSAGAHTVVLTQVSNTLYFDWAAGFNAPGKLTAPFVYIGNCLRMNATGYAAGSPFNAGSDTAVSQFNALIQTAISTLFSDGLAVLSVDASALYDPSADVYTDNIHPNDQGHAKIAAAFLTVMQ
jgi:lysophospholipase L1-like esterase